MIVSLAARRARVELLHSMANFAPAGGAFRRVVTIHDLQHLAVPELLSGATRTATHALVSLAARRADRIIAVSSAGAEEIQSGLGVEARRIDIVPNGVRPAPRATPPSEVREREQIGTRPIVLAVATNLPHKNLPALVEAMALIDTHERPMLLIAGHGTDDGTLRSKAFAAGVEQSVRLLGRRSTDELDGLYANAACLVLPTLHEGFGMPVLEALARSLPVACSDIPALREVAADAALYFDPRQPGQIAARIREVLGDDALSARLSALGPAHAAQFSWSAAAELTLASYRRALS